MQKVVWPTTMVASDSVMLLKLKNVFSAMPVMMPGRARGRMKSRLTTSRPKNRVRWIANAALEPRTRAIAVARSPAWSDTSKADRTFSSFQVALNHLSVSPGMGQLWTFEVLNAYKKIKTIGMYRNNMMKTVQTRR